MVTLARPAAQAHNRTDEGAAREKRPHNFLINLEVCLCRKKESAYTAPWLFFLLFVLILFFILCPWLSQPSPPYPICRVCYVQCIFIPVV